MAHDPVNNPQHYTSHPSGVECITITEHMGFNLGNAVKYIWRADLKADALEDLKKARWYVDREIARREAGCIAPDAKDASGWIEWKGGECPVTIATRIEYKMRNGNSGCEAGGLLGWRHTDADSDIVAYRFL